MMRILFRNHFIVVNVYKKFLKLFLKTAAEIHFFIDSIMYRFILKKVHIKFFDFIIFQKA
jgi:hypothetical protein